MRKGLLTAILIAAHGVPQVLMAQGAQTAPDYCETGGGISKSELEVCKKLYPQSRQSRMARFDERQQWSRITADNGAEYAIDIGNASRMRDGVVYARMCEIDVDGHHCVGGGSWMMHVRILWFDCHGHYADMSHPSLYNAGWQIAPPYSIVGRASQLACEKAEGR